MTRLAQIVAMVLLLCSTLSWADPININTADAKTLETIKGIGAKKAAAIVAYRDKHGNFTSVDELTKVKGISAAMVKKNHEMLTVGDAVTEAPKAAESKADKMAVDGSATGTDTALPDEVIEEPTAETPPK